MVGSYVKGASSIDIKWHVTYYVDTAGGVLFFAVHFVIVSE